MNGRPSGQGSQGHDAKPHAKYINRVRRGHLAADRKAQAGLEPLGRVQNAK
jgi:hypothetical protein